MAILPMPNESALLETIQLSLVRWWMSIVRNPFFFHPNCSIRRCKQSNGANSINRVVLRIYCRKWYQKRENKKPIWYIIDSIQLWSRWIFLDFQCWTHPSFFILYLMLMSSTICCRFRERSIGQAQPRSHPTLKNRQATQTFI